MAWHTPFFIDGPHGSVVLGMGCDIFRQSLTLFQRKVTFGIEKVAHGSGDQLFKEGCDIF